MSTSFDRQDGLRIEPAACDVARLALVAGLFALYAALGVRGYGNDNDTYHMLNTWNVLRAQGVYQPSRNTGYLVPEMAIGLFSSIGGHVLSNVAVSMLAAAVLWLFFGAVQRHVDRYAAILATLAPCRRHRVTRTLRRGGSLGAGFLTAQRSSDQVDALAARHVARSSGLAVLAKHVVRVAPASVPVARAARRGDNACVGGHALAARRAAPGRDAGATQIAVRRRAPGRR
jgi:hypothetical protein